MVLHSLEEILTEHNITAQEMEDLELKVELLGWYLQIQMIIDIK